MKVIFRSQPCQEPDRHYPYLGQNRTDSRHVVMFTAPCAAIVLSYGRTGLNIGQSANYSERDFVPFRGPIMLEND